ncbi:MAG: hypothetical protein ACJAQ0_001216 [Dasania sp.]|jgi:hypothetical protein
MYLKIKNGFADSEFYFLKKFLKMIDTELTELNIKIKKSNDPESDGLYDFAEHFIGHGFIAIQRYFASTYPQTNIKKIDALRVEPRITDNQFLAEVLNAAANYAKHEGEWKILFHPYEEGKETILKNPEKKTLDIIMGITAYAEYTLSNLLAEILKRTNTSKDLLLSPLLPLIEKWRYNLDLQYDSNDNT